MRITDGSLNRKDNQNIIKGNLLSTNLLLFIPRFGVFYTVVILPFSDNLTENIAHL